MSSARFLLTAFLMGSLLIPGAISHADSAGPWRVLLIYSYGRDFQPHASVAAEFRSQLARRATRPLELTEVSVDAARLAKDRLGAYLILGVLASFTFQVIYNITMSAGLVPVKGLTLPLMSYGGSSMIATLAGFGLILNVRMRRFTN